MLPDNAASWSPGRLEQLMRKYAYTLDDSRTKAYAAFVSPSDFLAATTPAADTARLDPKELAQQHQEIMLLGERVPGESFRTTGHEGRHRMLALQEHGVTRVAVIFAVPAVSAARVLEDVFVQAQRWSDSLVAQRGFVCQAMIPVSWQYKAQLEQTFIEPPADIRFSVAAEPAADVLSTALEQQRAAGWDPDWPFAPVDLFNADFRRLIEQDPELDAATKARIFEAGLNLGVVFRSDLGLSLNSVAEGGGHGAAQPGQPRAPAGGQYGPNGQWYKGGAFIATTQLPKKTRSLMTRVVGQGEKMVVVEPATDGRAAVKELPRIGQFPVFQCIKDVWRPDLPGGVNNRYIDYLRQHGGFEHAARLLDMAQRFQAGQRWASVIEHPEMAAVDDVVRMLLDAQPVPGAAIDKLAPNIRQALSPLAQGGDGLTVTFGGKKYAVGSIGQAQELWIRFREASGAGVSQIGNGVVVANARGEAIAKISYNGRAWSASEQADGKAVLIAQAPFVDLTRPMDAVQGEAVRGHESPRVTDLEVIEVDGVLRAACNSNGKPIHHTPEGVRAFWRWFGNSQSVDGHGRPLVVYRGEQSGSEHSVFHLAHTRESGFFFTPERSIAAGYSRSGSPREFYLCAPRVLNLSVDNDAARAWVARWASGFDEWVDRGSGEEVDAWDYIQSGLLFDYEGDWSSHRWRDLQSAAADDFDLLIVPDRGEGRTFDSYICFDPKRIKSASINRGTFDPQSVDIRFSKGVSANAMARAAAVEQLTRPIDAEAARALIAGKTEKAGGVDPAMWLAAAIHNGKSIRLGSVPLDWFAENEDGDRYDGTVDLERVQRYLTRGPRSAPPVIAVLSSRTGKLNILDGGHRISAARLRCDAAIDALVMLKSVPPQSVQRQSEGRFWPENTHIRFSFAGERAVTADVATLSDAKALVAAGEDGESVRQKTNWFQAADGFWRFEISDSQAQLKNLQPGADGTASRATFLADVLTHPSLFAAYPSLRSLDVTIDINPFKAVRGSFCAGTPGDARFFGRSAEIQVRAPTMETALGCLLHEIQHALQDIEGFAQGGSARLMELAGEKTPRTDFLYGMEKWNRWMRSIGYPDEKLMDPFADIAFNTEDVILSDLEVQGMWLAWRAKLPEHIIEEQMVRAFGESSPYKLSVFDSEPAYEQYRRLAGEVEARNVETRRSLTDVQRMGLSPAVTQDVRAKDIIISFNGNDVQRVSGKADQTQTEAFKRWFGGSKVVDDQGQPLVVYHGTGADFGTFDKQKAGAVWNADKMGFFFSSEPATASEYADFAASQTNGSANIMPVYASIKNPLTLERFTELTNGLGLRRGHGDGVDALTRFFDDERDLLLRYAKQEKNDGILLEKDGKKLVVAFSSAQIKSATGNRGTFDPANPDVRFSVADAAPNNAREAVTGKADQTQTEAFKRWFARSKVVDTEGRPLRVYHGTTGDVAAFDLAYSGSDGVAYGTPAIFATDDPLVASDYAKNKRNRTTADASRQFQRYKNEHPGDYGEDYERLFDAYKAAGRKEGWDTGGGGNVLPLYLSLQNPLEVDGGGGRFMQVMPQAVEQARAQGHDGLIVRAVIDHASPASEYPVTVYVAFHPEQIKSAIGNNGTFNPADPDIRFSFAAPAAMLEQDASGESEEAVCQKP